MTDPHELTPEHPEKTCLCEQTPCPCRCHQPTYAAWEEWRLRDLIHRRAERADLRGYSRQSRLAMEIAQQTGMSYPWILRCIEEHTGAPRRA